MSVTEGTALHVLACEPHVVALHEKGAESEGLRRSPVDTFTVRDGLRFGVNTVHKGHDTERMNSDYTGNRFSHAARRRGVRLQVEG